MVIIEKIIMKKKEDNLDEYDIKEINNLIKSFHNSLKETFEECFLPMINTYMDFIRPMVNEILTIAKNMIEKIPKKDI